MYQPGLHQDMKKYEVQRQGVLLFARRWQFVRRQLAISAEIYGKSVALWKLLDFTTLCCLKNPHWAREKIAKNVSIQFRSRHWYDRVWRLNCCGGVGMVHLNWKLSKVHESFVKKYKFADANLHYLVCNGVALHGMFWESMVDLGCGLQPFLLIGVETGSGFFRSRQDTTWVNQSRHLVSRWIVLVPIFQNINLLSKRNQLQDPVLSIQSHWYHRLSFE